MAYFSYNSKNIYYELHGEGSPILILNGIFMSASSWNAFIPSFSKNNKLILLDMFDQGKSDKLDYEYTQQTQVELIINFLKYINIEKVSIVGISYGGEIAQQVAAFYPELVDKLVLANTCAYTSQWLKDIGDSWQYSYKSYDGHHFFKTCIPIVYSPKFYEENYDWISAREEMFVKAFTNEVYDAFGRLTRSAESFDVRESLHKIEAETFVISAQYDYVTPPFQQIEIAKNIKKSRHITIEDAGHGVMYEKPVEFASTVIGFINTDTNIKTI